MEGKMPSYSNRFATRSELGAGMALRARFQREAEARRTRMELRTPQGRRAAEERHRRAEAEAQAKAEAAAEAARLEAEAAAEADRIRAQEAREHEARLAAQRAAIEAERQAEAEALANLEAEQPPREAPTAREPPARPRISGEEWLRELDARNRARAEEQRREREEAMNRSCRVIKMETLFERFSKAREWIHFRYLEDVGEGAIYLVIRMSDLRKYHPHMTGMVSKRLHVNSEATTAKDRWRVKPYGDYKGKHIRVCGETIYGSGKPKDDTIAKMEDSLLYTWVLIIED